MDVTCEQWIQVYDEQPPIIPMHHPHPHDAVSKITSPSSSSSMILSSNISPKSSNMSPKSSTVSKQVITMKRRSRASKKTPTTLLNANSSNFRALVQQFTGCPTTPLSLGVPFKGPITLNFQRGRREMQVHHHNTTATRMKYYNDDKSNNNNQVLHVHFHPYQQQQQQKQQFQQQQQQKQQVILEEQQNFEDEYMMMEKRIMSDDYLVDPSGYSSGVSSSSTSSGLEVPDDLTDFDGLMDDFSLHDLIDMNNAFSNDLGYFV